MELITLENAGIEFIDGDRGKNYPKIDEFKEQGYCLFLSAKNVTNKGFLFDEKLFISQEKDGLLRKGKLSRGDIVITTRGTVGNVALYNDIVPFDNIRINSGMVILRCNQQKYSTVFLDIVFRSEFFQNQIKGLVSGSAVPQLPIKDLKNLKMPNLSLENQKKVIDMVGRLENKIQLNTQINQTLEQIAQTIFKSWFIDFDPVHAKANALASGQTAEQATQVAMAVISGKNTQELHRLQTANPEQYQQLWEIAEAFPSGFDEEGVPWGWESKPLDEIAIYQNGLALQKFRPESEDEYLPIVKIAQLKQGYADGKEKASVNIKPECIIDNGDVIFSWSGSLVVDIWCGGKAALNQHLFKVTSKNYPKWLYYFYTVHHLAEFQRIAADKAVTMGHIKREHLSLALCVIPNNEFIQKFCFLEDYISQIVNNRLQNVSLIKIRDELLPKLLSGEV
ncbi:type I restriction-modification system, S subunit [Actinobacillus porcinus]|uniref:Type I restriction-modification system, S subunit n=1 Tax=Actinobacillus porcinus TaxID=51048 RepID=A0ABY6TK03_9PAST|nr:restriction endonuclease subunit S [Actinobacillus porcinus]VFY93248.1 type I restriction-modification system, S subunit [Actinobacillus porcinus]VTU08084.1 type I restriction-modification system, S subunit [Actinobacillus porcinus]